jgi:hypothetical protein
MVLQSIATPSEGLEYVSDRDGGFKPPLGRCKLLTRWAFEYFDQTGSAALCLCGKKGPEGRANREHFHVFGNTRLSFYMQGP